MKIQDLEHRSGLDRATIRYYEKEDLVHPSRTENRYRDYSEEDLCTIQKIKLLRQLDLPLESIRQLQQGNAELSHVLTQQIAFLQDRATQTDRAMDVCRQLQSSGESYSTMEPSPYLKLLNDSGGANPTVDEIYHEPNLRPSFYPWRRFLARMIDYALVMLMLNVLLIVILRIRPFDGLWAELPKLFAPLLSVPLTALCLSCLSVTPGKWIIGIDTMSSDGTKLPFLAAIRREWRLLRYGYGFGIPIYMFWRLFQSYKEYKTYGETDWEDESTNIYKLRPVPQKAGLIVLAVLFLIANTTVAVDGIRPKYRGNELSVAEFAENYNFYSEITELGYALNADGTWYISQIEPDNSFAIITSIPEKHNEPLRFEMDEDGIRRISYRNSWTEVKMVSPLGDHLICVCLTAVMSQRHLNPVELLRAYDALKELADEDSASIVCQNVEIRWAITSLNCLYNNRTYYGIESATQTYVSIDFEIIIH